MSGTRTFSVATEAELNAAISAIDIGGTASAADTAYLITLTADLTLTSNITAINLAAGDTLSIEGSNAGNDNLTAQLDGGGSYRGFVVSAGSVDLANLSLTAMSAPGGTGGNPGGGGALLVGANASVSTSAVTFTGDTAHGGTPAGGAVFVAQGGTFAVAGGSIAGSGSAAGNGIFIQGNDGITLSDATVTGVIADQTGSHLGTGAGSVVIQGSVTLTATNHYTGTTQIAGSLSLLAAGAAGSGPIDFTASSGETLVIGAGAAPTNQIGGFVPNPTAGYAGGDVIDLIGIGQPAGYTLSAANQLSVSGSQGTATFNLDPTQSYAADAFVLAADAGTGAAAGTAIAVTQTGFTVASEADLNVALASIDISGKWSVPGVAYTITLTAGFSLSTDLDAINLASGDTLTIDGAGNTLDGAGQYRGFFDYSGGLTLENLTIANAVAAGGAGGSGAAPGGGGAGLGGGLFVASGGAATLLNVSFTDDLAIGGAAGAAGGTGVGGGGGLGGAGGAGGTRSGGGGGIGLAATGGSVNGSIAGGVGIVVGAAGGIGGTGNRPAGGAGGADGGGGGAAGTVVTSGSGRGGGGSRTYPGLSGSGGVGGSFGGGAGSAEGAGFGGGGASSVGGWGGGGSGGAAGGFGGGGGGGAGGGLGAGGDVFVQQGGSLTIAGGSLAGGAVSGGAGSGGGGSGAALGAGIFVQGSNTLTLAPAGGQTLTIADAIADGAGSGGSGAAALIVDGAGTVDLSAGNSFSGGTTLKDGTLSLQAQGAAGGGSITFAYGAAATLIIGAGEVPTNTVSGFLPGEVIDLQGIGAAASAVLGAGDILTVSGGTTTVQLTLDPAQNFTGESFETAPDGSGGTLLTARDIGNDMPPSISGTATVAGDDHTPLDPLAGVTVSDLDPGQAETVTVALSSAQNGVLSNLAGGNYDAGTGLYTVTGSAAAVTAALDGLVFTPTSNQAAPGQTVTTVFNLSATDGLMTSAATATTVDITALNDAPVISGVPFTLVEGYWNVPLNPFPTAAIADPDVGATETVTFSLGTNIGSIAGDGLALSMPGMTLTNTGVGTYTLSPGTPSQVTAAIDAMQFTGVPDPSVPGYTITYVGLSVSDGIAPPVTADAEVLTGLPIFTGVTPNQTVTDGQSATPFATVAISDSAGLSIQGFSITLFDSSSDYLHPTDANGTLSGAGLVKTGVGTYTLTPGSSGAVSAELDALVFTPTVGNAPTTTDFNLAAFDGATTAGNGDTSVTAVPGPPVPAISGTVSGQFVADDATIAPFSTVAVSDANPSSADSATITLIDDATASTTDANGTLSGAGLTETSAGVYVLAATDPASLTAELDALVFTPTLNEVPPGYSVTTDFALAVTDVNGTVTDQTTSVVAIPSAVPPVIAGTVSGQLVADGATIDPFATATVTDANPVPSDAVTITVYDAATGIVTDADGALSGAGLSYLGAGTYSLAAADPATITAQLQALAFTPTPDLVAPGQSVTAAFIVTAADGLAVASDTNSEVTITAGAPPVITLDPVAGGNTVNAATALAGFAITGTTFGIEDGQPVSVVIEDGTGAWVDSFTAIVAGGAWSVAVTPAEAQALADGSYTVVADAANLGGVAALPVAGSISVNLAGIVAASPSISQTTVNFGAARVGDATVARSVTIGNGVAANPDQASLSYAVGVIPAPFAGDATAAGMVASGAAAPIDLTMATSAAGMFSLLPVSVALVSLGGASSGLPDTILPSAGLALSGKVYAPAVAQLSATAVDFGVVHIGDIVSRILSVSNAASGALTDVLTGGFGPVGAPFTATASLGAGVVAGASGPLTLGLKTTASGTFLQSVSLNLASHDPDLANIALTTVPIALSGTVDNYAMAALEKVSGSGTLTHSGTSYQLNLGTLALGAPASAVTLGALNAATGLADLLSGSFAVAAGTGFTNAGFTAFSGLGAGQADTAPSVTLSTATVGTFAESITLTPTGSNASGYAAALPAETLTITGTVAQPVFTLSTGADTVKGGAGNELIVAASNALSSGDSINGGGGVNTLALTGGGVFNLTLPSTLSNIQFITAQEGQGATAQTITLRPGLNATVNVASDTAGDPSPGITIVGASNSDVINLGSGNDTVTLGAGETVNGGGGNNTFNVTASTIKSTINGGAGTNALVVNGGGTVTMGAAITDIATVTLASTTTLAANATANLRISGSAAGGDVITLGAPSQAVTSGGANEVVKATAANAVAQVSGLGANSTLEITSGGTVNLNGAAGVATVKLDAATVIGLNATAFLKAVGSNGADTITAGGIDQTLTGGSGADTLIGYAGGNDTFLDKASGLTGDTIRNFLTSDAIDVTDLAFGAAKLTVTIGALNTVVKAVSGATTTTFTLAGAFSSAGFQLSSDGHTGTIIMHA